MNLFDSIHTLPVWLSVLLAVTAIFAVLALVNSAVARWAERRHPPAGTFIEVDGVRLHYSDRGTGRPIVLLHGNAVTGDDYNTSGVAERLVGRSRVIIFDRPGFGYSERPRGQRWTAAEQADLIHRALVRLGVRPAVVVGHSWGTLVALAFAERHPASTAGLVLLAGYYFPTARLDALLVAPVMLPVLGDILRYTISPLFGWLTMPLMKRAMFAPAPVTERFKREYSTGMALRPSQIRATASDGTLMVPGRDESEPPLRRALDAGGDRGGGGRQGCRVRARQTAERGGSGQHAADHRGCWAHGPSRCGAAGGGGDRGGRREV